MAEPAARHLSLPSGLLELCALLGASQDSLRGLEQIAQKRGVKSASSLVPEVLSVFVPPFTTKEDGQVPGASCALGKGRRRSFRKKREKPRMEPWKSHPGDSKGPDSEDVTIPGGVDLLALPQLCFPGCVCVASEPKEDYIHFLVLTDVCGNRTYGVVAQYYRPLHDEYCFYNGKSHWEPSVISARCFVPFAVCVVSRFPYYNSLKDCLSCLLTHLKLCKDFEVDNHIKDFAARLSLIPSPPPGPLHLIFNMKPLQVVFPSRADPESPIVDLDLHLPLLCFRPEKVLQILTCILTEQRIVFFSSDWALLTLMAECFVAYLHPLQWQHTFVPILSGQMLDFVMAPTSFLMGCHLDHFEEVRKEADGLVLIDIDHGSVTCSKSSDDNIDIPDVPLLLAQTFIQRVQSLQLHPDLHLAHLSASTDLNEGRARRRAWQQTLNCKIQHITLQLLVGIFREVKNHLNYEHRVFNSEEFLKTRAAGDQQFYKQVLDTYMFHSFLKARLNGRMDAFARMDLDTQSEEDRIDRMLISPRRPTVEKMASRKASPLHITHRRMVVSMPNLQDISLPELPPRNSSLRIMDTSNCRSSSPVLKVTPKSTYMFKIPDIHFPLESQCVQAYYTDFVTLLSKAMALLGPGDSLLLARYFYLRGLLHLMQGQLLSALLDFQNLYKTDIGIFPADLVKRTVESMSASERAQAERTPELRRLITEVFDKHGEAPKADDAVKNFELPKKHMQLNDFVKRVQESGIVKDAVIIHRLFDALTFGHEKQIDPETFRDFYTCWKETEAEAQEVSLPALLMEHLDKNECVYKLSSSVKTNRGVGKIAMTQKRLFLLTEGRPGYVEIATFRNIEEVKNSTVAFLLLRIPTLKIKTVAKKEVFEANLKSECDLWHLMVKEMWAGKQLADDHKDPQYVQQALTNVLLMDAVVGTLQSPSAIHAASKLAYFDNMKKKSPMAVPKTTSETLKHKINPSAGETAPQAIEVLLYTPGRLDPAEKVEDAHPKLWCALNEGKVVVFDASSWTVHQHCFKVGSSKVNCMVMAEHNQVWVGSEDSVIYIINVHSMSCNKQLTDHRSPVTGLAVHNGKKPSEIYSCSLDGTVIAWNVSTLRVISRFQLSYGDLLSISLHNDRIWCCTVHKILVVTPQGFVRQELKHPKDASFLAFQLLPEEQQLWAASTGVSELYMWSLKDLDQPPQKTYLQDCSEVTCMIRVKRQIWVGGRGLSQGKTRGKIYVMDVEKVTVEKELVAHLDTVRTLCSAEDRYVLSGAGQEEGKIAIWKVE
ncbi:DENN domain-containing protein 3 [Mus musculus]|uniref:DENN domain-containing protein 3 n=2 Tax=Mus musculus TaxID=10090 RepID=DEND3_MOUSE|nr:DENN domain-containing protein 3 [Mus musculus]A2RT67.2 RecName: Full=DENN domain-containing protein 3 [Mus musculus]AAI32390.2 DENN/MADD domain containing 3 [Mus musculus]AAI37792.1 DENN/MADD domain containing 3 [Mus musculus]|eukprot:NP_001074535.1 DENN domain-containing protein 3 precursor [Mus musculus]